MKTKILTIGSLTKDLFLSPRRELVINQSGRSCLAFCLGDKIRIQKKHHTFGGGGANVAVGLSRLGCDVAVLGTLGKDTEGKEIQENLKQEGVSTEFLQFSEKESAFSTILSSSSGERIVFFAPGASSDFLNFDASILSKVDAVCLEHLPSASDGVFQKIHQHFQAFPEKFLSWNPGRESLEKGVDTFKNFLSLIDVLLLNREEAQLFFKKKERFGDFSLEEATEYFSDFFAEGFQGKICITNGKDGAWGCDAKEVVFCPTLSTEPVDTLGAGDAFLSGFMGAILTGKTLSKAMKYATLNASAVVSHFGAHAGLQTREELCEQDASLETKTFLFYTKNNV